MLLYGITDCGLYRKQNEDYYTAAKWQHRDGFYFGVVCDGMGGAKGGALASRTATEAFVISMQGDTGSVERAMRTALRRANGAVYKKAVEDATLSGMGTTLVAAVANEDTVCVLHVGDSRAYLLHDGTLFRLTEDHSYVRALVEEGRMSEAEAETSAMRNIITRAVGVKEKVEGDMGAFIWSEGDRLLLCTDGLSGFVKESEIWDVLLEDKDIGELAHELVSAAERNGGDDNVTALLIENKKETMQNA